MTFYDIGVKSMIKKPQGEIARTSSYACNLNIITSLKQYVWVYSLCFHLVLLLSWKPFKFTVASKNKMTESISRENHIPNAIILGLFHLFKKSSSSYQHRRV